MSPTAPREAEPAPPAVRGIAQSAAELAARLPELMLSAERAARTSAAGAHGRRKAGPGEAFWQFRAFRGGEPAGRIDWRRSGGDDQLYVREREWEAARTLYVWADVSASMRFASPLGQESKADRALTVALCLAQLAAEGGERVAYPGLGAIKTGRRAARALADEIGDALMRGGTAAPDKSSLAHSSLALPSTALPRSSRALVLTDGLGPIEETAHALERLSGDGAAGHFVMVLDPIEESFPFEGRTEFKGLEAALKLDVGRAETLRDGYLAGLAERKAALAALATRIGWTFRVHHTDASAHVPILALHAALSERSWSGRSWSGRS